MFACGPELIATLRKSLSAKSNDKRTAVTKVEADQNTLGPSVLLSWRGRWKMVAPRVDGCTRQTFLKLDKQRTRHTSGDESVRELG